MRSLSIKKPLPRESFSPFESKVSIATADGLMRRTSSGRISCAWALIGIVKRSTSQTNFISRTRPSQTLHVSHDVRNFNILTLFCETVEQLDYAFRDFFPDRDSVRDADQIRIFELHTRAFVAIVEQHVETGAFQLVIQLLSGCAQIVLLHVCDRYDDVERRERLRPDDAVCIVMLLDRATDDAFD